MQLPNTSMSHVIEALGLVLLAYLARFLQKLHSNRRLVKGLPGPPHNYIFGSLASLRKTIASQPKAAAPQTIIQALKTEFDLPDVFYLDVWPLGPGPLMVICNIDVVNQITLKHSTLKHPLLRDLMHNFGGPSNLVSENGLVWKKWRSAFSPGFSAGHLMAQVPMIVDECEIFSGIMEKRAKTNELFRMEIATTKLTINVIGKVVLDLDLNAQHGPNVLVDAFLSQIRWQTLGAQFQISELWDIRRPIVHAWNNWRMKRWLSKRLHERLIGDEARWKSKHVIDLALEAYHKEVKGQGDSGTGKLTKLDSDFEQAAISNMKTFMFAGHDTTSSTICYALYYLFKYPETLARVRKEHDNVFGLSTDSVAAQLRCNPHLLNELNYTLAVTKEVLRLQPPGSTLRSGQLELTLHNPDTGEDMPTNHFGLFPVILGIHRNPRYWPNPHVFNPDRFVPASSVYHENVRDAWMPFSKGSRSCIGQELAIIEMKVVLAIVIRKFDFVAAYHELDKLRGDGSAYPSDMTGTQTQFGERAYQVQMGAAKPAEGMPCRLSLAKRT